MSQSAAGVSGPYAYGIFNTVYGAAWFVGGTALGLLYDLSNVWLPVYVAVIEAVALLLFPRLRKAADRRF